VKCPEIVAAVALSLFVGSGVAQEEALSLDDMVQSAQEWVGENVDDRVLGALESVDWEPVQPLLRDLQTRFQGDYVLDLAGLRDAARDLLAELETSEETRPYAAWLRARMDYLEMADTFRLIIPPPPVKPGEPPALIPNPEPETQRAAWKKSVEARPAPAGAAAMAQRLQGVFTEHQVPPALVWLAEVESGFNPSARSPVGAVGLYQLMPKTARSLGLSLRPTDERLDPDKNARAAARYLRYLHPKFNDWRLTLAAYNAGEGRVLGLMKRQKARTFDAIARHLPAETQMYVPRVEAVLQRREGVALASLPAPGAGGSARVKP